MWYYTINMLQGAGTNEKTYGIITLPHASAHVPVGRLRRRRRQGSERGVYQL